MITPDNHHRAASGGFTLVEVLLTTLLSATLLLGIWSLLTIYIGLFDDGTSKAEQAHLVSALMRRLSDDLSCAIQDPVARDAADALAPTAARRFGLFGSENELRFDVLQITPFQTSLTPATSGGDHLSRSPLRAPELRTIYYRFEAAADLADGETTNQPGLSRRELDFETPFPEGGDADLGGLSPAATQMQDRLGGSASSPEELLVVDPNDDSVMLAPEVTACRFRYFDGRRWSGSWNSLQRKSLPVAVEVTIQVSSMEERERAVRAETAPRGDQLAVIELDEPLFDQQLQPLGPFHRLVIDIPSAPMHQAPKRPRSTAERVKPRAIRITPRVRPRAPKSANLPDEWMRTER